MNLSQLNIQVESQDSSTIQNSINQAANIDSQLHQAILALQVQITDSNKWQNELDVNEKIQLLDKEIARLGVNQNHYEDAQSEPKPYASIWALRIAQYHQ